MNTLREALERILAMPDKIIYYTHTIRRIASEALAKEDEGKGDLYKATEFYERYVQYERNDVSDSLKRSIIAAIYEALREPREDTGKAYKGGEDGKYTEKNIRDAIDVGLALSTMTDEPFTSKNFKTLKEITTDAFLKSLQSVPPYKEEEQTFKTSNFGVRDAINSGINPYKEEGALPPGRFLHPDTLKFQPKEPFPKATDDVVYKEEVELEQLRQWKKEAIAVMPDFQKIGKLLGLKLGESVNDKIIPFIEKCLESKEEAGEEKK